jgi:hypothetical protein
MTSHREHTYQALSKDLWPTLLRTMHTKPSLPYQDTRPSHCGWLSTCLVKQTPSRLSETRPPYLSDPTTRIHPANRAHSAQGGIYVTYPLS